MSKIERESWQGATSVEQHEAGETEGVGATTQAAPIDQPTSQNVVEAHDGATSAAYGSATERVVGEKLATLEEGESMELEVSAKLDAGVEVGAQTKASVRRLEDGSYEVALEDRASVGVGNEELRATAEGGVGAKQTYHFRNATDAARFVDAKVNQSLTTDHQTIAALARRGGVLEEGNGLDRYQGNLSKVEVAVDKKVEAKLEVELGRQVAGLPGGEAKLAGSSRTAVEVDRERHVLVVRTKAELEGALPMGPSDVAGKTSIEVTQELRLTKAETERCLKDPFFLAQKQAEAARLPGHTELEAETEVRQRGQAKKIVTRRDLETGHSETTLTVIKNDHAQRLPLGFFEGEVRAHRSREYHGASLRDCERQAREAR